MLRALAAGLKRIEQVMTAIAAVCMFTVMLVVTVDVAMRYALHSPLSWAYDFISLYLMAGLFFLVISDGYASHSHVNVDILYKNLPPAARAVCDLVTLGAGIAFFAAIAHAGWLRFWSSYEAADVLAGAIPWPMWPSYGLVPLGAGIMALRLLLHLVNVAVGLASGGRELVPALTLPGGHAAGE